MVVTKKAIHNELVIKKAENYLKNLEIEAKDISLYILSFIHRSIVNERPDYAPEHNERLEFLGDAVLELVVTSNLYTDYRDKPEWELTDIRSALVRWKNLAIVAKNIWLQEMLFLWNWEEKWWWRDNDYILANTLEAFLWAIYIDLWIDKVTDFINTHVYSTIKDILSSELIKDYKTAFQELSQAHFDITPTYEVESESWPDHDKSFVVWVYLWDEIAWKWEWSSKKKAQESAAQDWYNKIKNKEWIQ